MAEAAREATYSGVTNGWTGAVAQGPIADELTAKEPATEVSPARSILRWMRKAGGVRRRWLRPHVRRPIAV